MQIKTPSTLIFIIGDVVGDLDNAIARLWAAIEVDDRRPAKTADGKIVRQRIRKSLRSLRVIRAGLLGARDTLIGEMAP